MEELKSRLRYAFLERKTIRNWTFHNGYIGENFDAQSTGEHRITCYIPKEISVPIEDIEKVYLRWDDYLAGKVPRSELRNITRHSKYIISILHHLINGRDE